METLIPDIEIRRLCDRIEAICRSADELEAEYASAIETVHPRLQQSARNLVHYLALRHADIRGMQEQLNSLGLSSLGNVEGHTKASLQAVLRALRSLYFGDTYRPDAQRRDFARSKARLDSHTIELLGESRVGRNTRIMVTLDSDFAEDHKKIASLLDAGIDIARINCAHDSEEVWHKMIANIRCANSTADRPCKIFMDLAGPKVRTGELKPGPRVLRARPKRDALGRVIAPRRLRLVPDDVVRVGRGALLPVPRKCVDSAEAGDVFRFRDARGRKRKLIVVGKDERGLIAELYKTAYVATGARLRLVSNRSSEKHTFFSVGTLPSIEQPILLRTGDTLILHAEGRLGRPAKIDTKGRVVRAAHIACVPSEVLRQVPVGTEVGLNDGKIVGVVETVTDEGLVVVITRAKHTGSRLRGNKGINFPGVDINLEGLTEIDKENLSFVVKHADAVSLSFVREPEDVYALQRELAKFPDRRPGVVLKIETERGFRNLPQLLLAGMRSHAPGVMIARGDLAVECGWERLAEIQEEILWMCEAAQIPVIWATQVLESETKKGQPSRAEISDAAMSQRADCVMLNKGPHIEEAIAMLDDILRRMQGHQSKKRSMLRKLGLSEPEPAIASS